MVKKIMHIPRMNMSQASKKIRDVFFELAAEHIFPIPDVRNFKTSQMHTAPKNFNANFHITLKRKGAGFEMLGTVSSQEENTMYMEICYNFS